MERSVECPRCHKQFSCGVDAPSGCWCTRRKHLRDETLRESLGEFGSHCLCPECLEVLVTRNARS